MRSSGGFLCFWGLRNRSLRVLQAGCAAGQNLPRVEDALGKKEVDLGEEAVRSLRTGRRRGARLCVCLPTTAEDSSRTLRLRFHLPRGWCSMVAFRNVQKFLGAFSPCSGYSSEGPSGTGVSSFIFPVSCTRGGGCWSPLVPVASC